MNQACSAIASFAAACERLNSFARSLRDQGVFSTVHTGADIRNYETGWRLEKWVEAELNPAEGQWATWWFELGCIDDSVNVSSSLSISHGDCFISLPDRLAASVEELDVSLAAVIDELVVALDDNREFAHAVAAALTAAKRPGQ